MGQGFEILTRHNKARAAAVEPSEPGRYDKMTQDDFDRILEEIAGRMGTNALLTIPGVWEAVSEELNNDILEQWEFENPEEDEDA